MSIDAYNAALKLGQKESKARAARGEYPYLQVLDEITQFAEIATEEPLGLVNIPINHIVGTKNEGRRNAFAANFMPLLGEKSEFASKWSALADAHLEEGIHDAIVAYEFMNRFYVLEGNKRVSVLKFYGAVSIPGTVRRVIPKKQDTVESRVYYDFLEFYRLTKVNSIWFSQPGRFKSLLIAICGEERPWTDDERMEFNSAYFHFRKVFKAMGGDRLPGTTGDAFLPFIKVHDLHRVSVETDAELKNEISKTWSEMVAFQAPEPVELAMDPETDSKSIIGKILPKKADPIKALFLYQMSPETSGWTLGHEEGRLWAEERLGGKVITCSTSNVSPHECEAAILSGIGDGMDVVFTASSELLPACIRAAAKKPDAKILNCCVYCPHPSIRTYHGRMFEVKFLSGLIAGAMTRTHNIGYMADFPIYGSTAALNAFAMGVRMTDPWAKIYVEWRAKSLEGTWERLVEHDVDMISGQDNKSPIDPWRAYGLYQVKDGEGRRVSAARWIWGRFYELILRAIIDGNWKRSSDKEHKAINYWWGLSAGVVDIKHTDLIPPDTLRLAAYLRNEMRDHRFNPFEGILKSQDGTVMSDGGVLTPEQIVKMDYLAENIIGEIPVIEEVTPEAAELVRLLGVRAEDRKDVV